MISYWHDTVFCLSVCLSPLLAVVMLHLCCIRPVWSFNSDGTPVVFCTVS